MASRRISLADRYFFGPAPKVPDDYSQFWIRYRPQRVLSKQLENQTTFKLSICVLLTMIIAALFIAYGAIYAAIAFLTIVFLSILVRARLMLFPTHIRLSQEGISLNWLQSFCRICISSPMINWDRLTHVSISGSPNSSELQLQFNVIARGMNFRQRISFALLQPELARGFLSSDRCQILMKLNGIASSDDRKRLQLALAKFVPAYRVESRVNDELNLAIKLSSYTDIWLDALSLSPRRIRNDYLTSGTRIGQSRYEIVQEIGAGGQAIIYEAHDLNDPYKPYAVVLKEFVLPAHAGVNVRKRVLENIQREVNLLKQLNHKNIVRLLDFFIEDQRAYLVLEHITGSTLKHLVQHNGPLPEKLVAALVMQMCEILDYLHRQVGPIIHRDFTPDNLMVDDCERLKLIDFNVAEQFEANAFKTVVGKHSYIPPEQFRGKPTIQSDIYALGATMFFMLTATEPEPITQAHPKLINEKLTEQIDKIVAKATEIEPAQRYSNASVLKNELTSVFGSFPEPSPHSSPP